jgi:thioredoxin reductase (NADPH)
MAARQDECLDCVIVGGGPAGLTAALYLARFNRSFLLVDGEASRAQWIPASHNIPVFANGVAGPEILALQRAHLARYGIGPSPGNVTRLATSEGGLVVEMKLANEERKLVATRRVLLATGSVDIEPDLPGLPNAVQRGLVRFCPICDGFEAAGKRIAVLGYGSSGIGEAIFIARTYSRQVTLLTLGQAMKVDPTDERKLREHNIRVINEPVEALCQDGDRIASFRLGGGEESFDVLYSALGLKHRTELALELGARHDGQGALLVDEHNRTSVPGLYAAGGAVRGLDQIVVAMGQAAVAATNIHNRCELSTQDEPQGQFPQ